MIFKMRHALGKSGVLLPPFVLLAIAIVAAVAQGKDLNWDQLNYHYYIAHAMLTDRLHLDFMAASVQSYLNPLAHLPFYLVASSSMPSALSTAVLGAIHGLNFVLVYGICRTLVQPGAYRTILALVFTGISISHPVVLAEVGTSLAELVASLPVLGGVWMLMKLDGLTPRYQLQRIGGGFLLLGAASALKLPYAIFCIACFPALLVHSRQAKPLLIRMLVAGSAAAIGFGLLGGLHFLAIWEKFGNPFFPFFNNLFASPYYPAIKLVNDRFLQSSLQDIITLPVRMLSLSNFVTTETMVVDPRYLIISAMALVPYLIRYRKRRRGAIIKAREDRAAAPLTKLHAPPLQGATVVLFTVCAVSYPLWCLTSGNGRYGLPLHLLSGAVLLALFGSTQLDRKKILDAGGLLLVAVLFILGLTFENAVWTRVNHTASWYDVVIPDAAKVEDALYLSAGFKDRTTNSFLIPQFPPSAKFGNINGYANLASGRWSGTGIDALIASQGTKPVFILAEGWPANASSTSGAEARAAWVSNLNLNLQGFGLELGGVTACHKLVDMAAGAAVPFATVCPLVKRPRSEARLEKAHSDAAFDRLEMANAKLFYPRGDLSYFRSHNEYCRVYASTEYYLCEREGRLVAFRIDPPSSVALGKLNDVVAP